MAEIWLRYRDMGTRYGDSHLPYAAAAVADHQGSAVALAGAGAAPSQINRYDEYGRPDPANLGRFQYTGQAWIPELGLYHYKARVYDPALGRFLQTDPIGYDDQINLYAYVGNDPLNRVDPSGLAKVCATRSGSRLNACVGVDGDGDGDTKDADLTRGQIKAMSAAFGTFISRNAGADLSGKGANVSGDPGDATNFVRAASQFVGAAVGGLDPTVRINVGNSEAASFAKFGSLAFQGYRVGSNTAAVTTGTSITINTDFQRQFVNASELARTRLHERYHTYGGRWGGGIAPSDHRALDYWARRRLMEYGLGDAGCQAIGGFFGIGGTYPACGN